MPRSCPAMRLPIPALLLLAIGLLPLAAADGTLGRAKAEVHPRPAPAAPAASTTVPAPSRPDLPSPSGTGHHHEGDSFSGDVLGLIVVGIILIPVGAAWLGMQTVAPDGVPSDVGLAGVPYVQSHPGWLGDQRNGGPTRLVGAQVQSEFGMIERDLQRYGIGARLWITAFAQISTDYHRYFEQRGSGGHDTLTVGCTDLSLGIPLTSRGHLHLGVGVLTYHDEVGTESGAAFAGGFDLFPVRPLVVSVAGNAGSIGSDAEEGRTSLRMLRASLGACIDRFEIYGGWQGTWIGQVRLSGPMAGLRVWF